MLHELLYINEKESKIIDKLNRQTKIGENKCVYY